MADFPVTTNILSPRGADWKHLGLSVRPILNQAGAGPLPLGQHAGSHLRHCLLSSDMRFPLCCAFQSAGRLLVPGVRFTSSRGGRGDKLGQRMSWGHPGHAPFPAPWESQACGPHFPTAESRLQGRLQAVLWLKADCCKPGVRQLGNTRGCPEVWGWSGCLSGRVCACGRPVMPSWGACHISSFAS